MLKKAWSSLSLLGVLACAGWSYGRSDGLRAELAVVDRERLWQRHGSYAQLEQADWELGRLQTEKLDLLTRAQSRCDRLFQEQAAQRLWDCERTEMQARVEQVTRRFRSETEREIKQVQQGFAAQLKASVQLEPDWQLMGAAAVARFRLDKQRALSLRLQARQRQIEEDVVRFEAELARRSQDEKVRLQVKLQLAEDQEARRRLAALDEELEGHRAERRRLAEVELSDYRSIEEGQLAIEVREYEEGLRRELTPPVPDLAPLRTRLAELQKLRQGQLVEVVKNLEASARKSFQRKLANLPRRHEPAGEILPEAFLDFEERARLQRLPDLIGDARRRREKVYTRLQEGVSSAVGEQARKRDPESVISDARLNLELEDLTDVSLAGVSQLSP